MRKAARRRLFNSNRMILIQAALGFFASRLQDGPSTSGARGLKSRGGAASSTWDFRSTAFLTKAATSFGSEVDWANLTSVLT
jgi:hypothetical protein